MKKQHISKVELMDFDPSKFNTEGALLTEESINTIVTELTPKTKKTELNKAKKETVKGTQVVSYMIRKDLLKKIKLQALTEEVSMSEIINRAVENYFQ